MHHVTMAGTGIGFDHPEVNVDLAKEYMILHENDMKIKKIKTKDGGAWDFEPKKREMLAKKIQENLKLICQLEYMTNKTPIEETEKNIQLMLQYLSLSNKYRITTYEDSVTILKTTPLALFIYFAELGKRITVCEERSAVCYLLLKLCEDTGLSIRTFEVNVAAEENNDLYDVPGCTGIVSERSDLDSAVDAFLSCSYGSGCLWRIRRIFVQESIVQSFKELIEFKAKLNGTKTEEYKELKKLSSDFFVYDDKVLLFDYAGDIDAVHLDSAHVVFIEAYRTNKEVLSLVGDKASTGCVSLWCADVAEANELAYSVPASLVWINDYGNFDGPAEISTFLLNFLWKNLTYEEDVPKHIIDSYEIWKTYDNKKRADIISNVLEQVKDVSLSDKGNETNYQMLKLQEQITYLKFNAVYVADGKICVTLDSPVGFNEDYSIGFNADLLGSLVIGNGIICWDLLGPSNESLSLHRNLQQVGVPIWSHNDYSDKDKTNKIKYHTFRHRTKVVITNFGTIFAN